MYAVLESYRSRVIDPSDGPSAAFQPATERALPVNDPTRRVVSLEHVVVDYKSFVAHPGVEIHGLIVDT